MLGLLVTGSVTLQNCKSSLNCETLDNMFHAIFVKSQKSVCSFICDLSVGNCSTGSCYLSTKKPVGSVVRELISPFYVLCLIHRVIVWTMWSSSWQSGFLWVSRTYLGFLHQCCAQFHWNIRKVPKECLLCTSSCQCMHTYHKINWEVVTWTVAPSIRQL